MTEQKTNITKNASYLTIALVIQKILSFSYFTIIARELGPDDLGKYYFAISFTTVVAIVADLGLANVLTREVAKRKGEAKILLGNVLGLKIPLALLSIVFVGVAIGFGDYSDLMKKLMIVSLSCVILDSFTATFYAIARGFHNLKYESISSGFFHAVVISVGLPLLFLRAGLVPQMAALLAASSFQFIFSAIAIWKKVGVSIRPSWDKKIIKEIITISLPFAIFVIFQRLYINLDSVLLGHFASVVYVGYYQISFRIIFALQFIPSAFTAAVYPAMSSFWTSNKEQLATTFEKSMVYLAIIAMPISAGVMALADKIILLFKSGYEGAVLPMQIIIISLFFIFIGYPLGSLLNACDRQKQNTRNMIIVTVFSIVMNLLLIPRFFAVGAAITVLVTNVLMVVLGLFQAGKILSYDAKKVFGAFLKILLASLAIGALAFYLKNQINVFIDIVVCIVFYPVLILLLRVVKKDEIAHIKNSFLKK
jgi:O-antigen/teichoic acid export membrane protein